ncbi:uncharacterized protein LOC128552763 [Mercenaria mercenaria]|uniref:uncharacterized protein LOC128552763 n=1 Tax=Mercenaria mercenaria TaxID=6596 RepID=UPI00234F34F2|nr:uncharacterized protein LOC128552763 [Mercenaria mercenaria]
MHGSRPQVMPGNLLHTRISAKQQKRINKEDNILEKLKSTEITLKVQHEKFQREIHELMKKKTATLEHIRTFRTEINDRLDELEQNTVASIEVRYKSFIIKLEKEMKAIEGNKASIQSARDRLVSAVTNKNASQTFVDTKKGNEIVSKVVKSMEESKPKPQEPDIEFRADSRLPALLQELYALGNITQTDTKKAEHTETVSVKRKSSRQINKKSNISEAGNVPPEAKLQIIDIKKYSVKIPSDEYACNIKSACTLEDGTILLSDHANNKLKRLDSLTYSVIDFCDLPRRPWQACSISLHQAAVCLPYKQEVHFISLTDRMTFKNELTTDFKCYGLAYADNNLYISDRGTSIYIYSVLGRKLQQFSRNLSGQMLFSNICSVVVYNDGSKIYVVDSHKGLIVLDKNGKVCNDYNGTKLSIAYDSYLTEGGSLLMFRHNSRNVIIYELNGKLIGEVVKFDDKSAWQRAICCNQQMFKMIIGGNRDDIEVFDLI